MKTLSELTETEKLSIRRRKHKGTSINEIAEIIGTWPWVIREVLNSNTLKNNTK